MPRQKQTPRWRTTPGPNPSDSDTHANDETGADHDSEMGGESATDGEGEAQGEIGSDIDAETGDGRTTTVSGPESRPESEAEPGTGEEAEYGSDQEGLDGEHELADITLDEADRVDVSEPGAQAARVPEFRPVAGLSEDETQALLNCLCRASLGAASYVSQSYNLTIPRWADPKIHSCGSLANGLCMASAFGCWRSFIRFNSEQARGCVTGAGLDPDAHEAHQAISVPQHGSLRVDADADEGLTVRLQLQDADGRQLISDWQGSSATRSVEQADLAPGTYVARVHRAGGEGGYRLTSQLTASSVRNDSEAGDTFQQAVEQRRPLPLNQHSTGLLGFVDRSIRDTDDWVSLNVTEYGALSVSETAEESLTVRLLLLDADGRPLASDWQGVHSSRRVVQLDLPPGHYYVRVHCGGGTGGGIP